MLPPFGSFLKVAYHPGLSRDSETPSGHPCGWQESRGLSCYQHWLPGSTLIGNQKGKWSWDLDPDTVVWGGRIPKSPVSTAANATLLIFKCQANDNDTGWRRNFNWCAKADDAYIKYFFKRIVNRFFFNWEKLHKFLSFNFSWRIRQTFVLCGSPGRHAAAVLEGAMADPLKGQVHCTPSCSLLLLHIRDELWVQFSTTLVLHSFSRRAQPLKGIWISAAYCIRPEVTRIDFNIRYKYKT